MSHQLSMELLNSFWQTIYMVFISGLIATLIGMPLGVILITTRKGNILENQYWNSILGGIVNGVRSIPFIILLVAIVPLTRLLVGTSIGTTAAIVPLSIGAIPFVARVVENALTEVPYGLIEAGLVMGATPQQIIFKILVPEALPGIVNGVTIMLIALVGYSAMAGAIGGGGLGDLAIRYGYQRFDITIMLITIVILIFLVQLLQVIGDMIVKQITHR